MREQPPSTSLKVLVFAASLRARPLNQQLAALAARAATSSGAIVDLASMSDFDVLSYDGDLETESGIADATLRARFEKAVLAFLSFAEAAKHYPCMKRAWVEFLGRTVDRVTKAALCRCGQSSNKPFCDGTHTRVGFKAES